MGLRELALGQGSGLRTPLFLTFGTSRTWTVPFDMDVIIHAIGGFASGGAVVTQGNATGGGAPGYTAKRTKLTAGTVLTISVGAAGAAANLSAGGAAQGGAGGATTVTGGGLNMVANGGGPGAATTNLATSILGGPGGTASGGDINLTGGRGGNIAGVPGGSSCLRATGAGAVNLFGIGECDGGDLTNTTLSTTGIKQATGGASCTGPGASSGVASDVITSAGDLSFLTGLTPPSSSTPIAISRAVLGLSTAGPPGGSTLGGNFAGSQGNYATGSSGNAWQTGLFGGSGGIAAWGGSAGNNQSAGSAGGAAASSSFASSSTGRKGLVMLEILS